MNKPIYNVDVERICNPHAETASKMAQRRTSRMLLTIIAMLTGILIGMVLWLLNVYGGEVTAFATAAMSCVAAFVAGRLWEVIRK